MLIEKLKINYINNIYIMLIKKINYIMLIEKLKI